MAMGGVLQHLLISIHALREEGDALTQRLGELASQFLSTPSARRATSTTQTPFCPAPISIHALREEGDPKPPSM